MDDNIIIIVSFARHNGRKGDIRDKERDNNRDRAGGIAYIFFFTKQYTSWMTFQKQTSWTLKQHVWHFQKLHEHLHPSWLNIQGTCRHQSFVQRPFPS